MRLLFAFLLPLLAACSATPTTQRDVSNSATTRMNSATPPSAPSPHAVSLEGFVTFTVPSGASAPTKPLNWVTYLPREYAAGKPMPLIIFLHGRGECGSDGWKQVAQGLGRAVMFSRERWPFVILFPQKPEQNIPWADHTDEVMAGIAYARTQYNIDASRIYLTGLSQGGAGTWVIASRHPNTFAAIAPVCGFGDPATLTPGLTSVPVWCFHGGADDVVLPDQSRRIVESLRNAGNIDVAYTEFAGVDHNSWDPAYNTPQLPDWFLARSR
jgi:predicted peptidase